MDLCKCVIMPWKCKLINKEELKIVFERKLMSNVDKY